MNSLIQIFNTLEIFINSIVEKYNYYSIVDGGHIVKSANKAFIENALDNILPVYKLRDEIILLNNMGP
jgi:hypothetical protein